MSTEIVSPAVERVSNSVPQLVQCTCVVVYAGCMSVFTKSPPCVLQICATNLFYNPRKGRGKGGRKRLSCDRPEKNVLAADALQLAQELRVGAGLLELLYE